MAIAVANLPFFPTATPDVPAAAAAPSATTTTAPGEPSPFQTALAAATQTAQVDATATADAPVDVTAAELDATDAAPIDIELDTEIEPDADTTLTADSSLAGLLAFVTQTLAPPENAAVAQATGQQTELLTATALAAEPAARPAADATRSRADQQRLDRNPALPLPTTQTTPTDTLPVEPTATTTSARVNQQTTASANVALPVPVEAEPDVTPAEAARIATTATPTRTGSSIPAQAPLVANLIPTVPVPANLSVEAPPVSEPTAAVAAAGLPSAQLGERPATAGEQFVADANAGARLVSPAAGSAVFANTLAQETPSPAPLTIPSTPVTVEVTRATSLDVAQPLLPVAVTPITAEVSAGEAAPVATFGRAVADIARVVARATAATAAPAAAAPAFTTSLATEFNAGRLTTDTIVPVAPAAREEAKPSESLFGAPVVASAAQPAPALAPAAVSAPAAPRATPAAQVADTIVTQAQVLQRDGAVEFQMRLDPPDLGRLHIRLVTRGDEVHGQVIAASEAVRGMIESQLPELRQRLEAAGVTVNRFEVSADPNSGGSGRNPYRDAAQEFAPRTANATTGAPRARVGRSDGGGLDVTV